LLHTGSRVRGEVAEESDYDVSLIVRTIDSSVIEKLRRVFLDYPNFSAYVLSEHELETLPRAQLLQFLYADKLYGDMEYELPTKEEVEQYISFVRREWLDRLRHYLIFPHSREELRKNVRFAMKHAYLYLSYLAFLETDKLPRTRRHTIAYFEQQKRQDLGIRLLVILENWDYRKDDIMENPGAYLLLLEEFFRESRP
jgi:predicted nucleotidyltransferase